MFNKEVPNFDAFKTFLQLAVLLYFDFGEENIFCSNALRNVFNW